MRNYSSFFFKKYLCNSSCFSGGLFPQAGQTMGNTMPAVENPAETAQSQLASMLNTGSMNIA